MSENTSIEIRKQKLKKVQSVFTDPKNLERFLPYFNGDKSKAEKFKQTLAMIAMSDKFLDVDPNTILKCGINCAELGLSPQPSLGQAYFVTYKKKLEFTIGTKGYITLLERAKKACKAYLIYDVDQFYMSIAGFDETFSLVQNFKERKESDTKWVDAHLKGGLVLIKNLVTGILTTTFVPVDKLKSLRARSPSFNGQSSQYSPWNTSASEMFLTKSIRYVISKTSLDENSEQLIKALSLSFEDEIEEAEIMPTLPKTEEENDVDEARIELMDLITKGDSKLMNTLKQFISSSFDGKQLKDLTYEECHVAMGIYEDSLADLESKKEDQKADIENQKVQVAMREPGDDSFQESLYPDGGKL